MMARVSRGIAYAEGFLSLATLLGGLRHTVAALGRRQVFRDLIQTIECVVAVIGGQRDCAQRNQAPIML